MGTRRGKGDRALVQRFDLKCLLERAAFRLAAKVAEGVRGPVMMSFGEKKINVIKVWRQYTHERLKEAKEAVLP